MKEKLLNFLIIFLIIFLTMNYFSNNSKNNTNIESSIKIDISKSFTVPANVKLTITNNTSTWFTFDTCNDLTIKKDSRIIKNDICEIKTLKTWENTIIDFTKSYDKFIETWIYYIVLKNNSNEILSQFEIENRWFIWKFFVFFFYAPIYNLMAFLLEITAYNLWWAIVIITIIIRILLLYPQHKMLINQKKMQLIQPKLKEIQQKHKWDYQNLWMETMKLYKEENVNPMGSLWLLFIQLPVLLVIYNVIVWIQDYSNNYYLYGFLWDYKIDSINAIFYSIDLFKIWWTNWLILAIIVAILQFIQIKLSLSYNKTEESKKWVVLEKKKDSNDYQSFMPDPEFINKFMLYWMPIMIWIATYTFFAWVGLYWGIWTVFMIVQQLFVNKIFKK